MYSFRLPCTGTREWGSGGGSEGTASSGRTAGPRGAGTATGTGTARAAAPPCGRLRPGSPVRAGSRAGAGAARSRPAPGSWREERPLPAASSRVSLLPCRVSFMNNQKPQKPTLSGQRFKTRKRGELPHRVCCQDRLPALCVRENVGFCQ